MKAMMHYLLRGKRGVFGTVTASAASMLLLGLGYFVLGIGSAVYQAEALKFDLSAKEIMDIMRFVPGDLLEIVSLITGAVWFALLCSNAFRFGMANGVSRRTVIRATAVSGLLTAVLMTAVNEGIRLGLTHWTPYLQDDSLYMTIFRMYHINPSEKAVVLTPSLDVRAVLCYFAASCILAAVAACLFALYRRLSGGGLLCGSLITIAFWIYFLRIRNNFGLLAKRLNSMLYYEPEPVTVDQDGFRFMMIQPRGIPMMILVLVLVLIYAAVYAAAMKKTAVKKGRL